MIFTDDNGSFYFHAEAIKGRMGMEEKVPPAKKESQGRRAHAEDAEEKGAET
jgi:hypothetical protein